MGPKTFEKAVQAEIRRVAALKNTGVKGVWKDAGDLDDGGPYRSRYGDRWREVVKGVLGKGSNACLLYTSPSPRDRQKSRMPSSA